MIESLNSWNDGAAKTAILDFVRSVTEPGGTRTGRKPLLAGGNADGDAAMLAVARFGLLIRHDDAVREFAYDAGAEQALPEATKRGWTVVSVRDDFATVFDA